MSTENIPTENVTVKLYACTGCWLAAHDSSYKSELVEHDDVSFTDWACPEHEEDPTEVCTYCDDTGTEFGVTIGGKCDLGNHQPTGLNGEPADGYWEYHVYTNYGA